MRQGHCSIRRESSSSSFYFTSMNRTRLKLHIKWQDETFCCMNNLSRWTNKLQLLTSWLSCQHCLLAYLHVIMMDKSYFFRKRLNNLTEHLLRRKGSWKLNPGAWEDPRNLNPELLTNEIFLATVFSFQHHIPSNIGKMGWFMALVKCSEYSHGDNPC